MGIQHLEDLPLAAFIKAVKNIGTMHATEKLDGANLWMGLDEEGKLFTSREGKRKGAKRFYSEAEYPHFAAYNGFRAAHAALEAKFEDIRRVMQPNQMVEMEVLYGRQPNAVTYGADDKSYIAFLRGVEGTPDVIADQLTTTLGGQSVQVTVDIVETSDGENLDLTSTQITYQFTGPQRIPTEKLKDVNLDKLLKDLEDYLQEPAGLESSPELTNLQVLQNSLGSIPVEDRPAAKDKKAEITAKVMTGFKLPIKKELLDNYVSKIKPALGDKDVTADEDVGIEGVVLRDPTTGDLIKLVDKDTFTTINSFNHAIRNQISGVVKTLDGHAPLEARGGILGNMKIQIADLLGNKELARGMTAKKAFEKVKGATPVDTVKAFASNLEIDDFLGTRRKMLALIQQAAKDLKTLLDDFKEHKDNFQLKLKNGKTIGISPEIEKRTLLVFAESRRNISELFEKVKKAKSVAQLVAILYGHLAKAVHDNGDEAPITESRLIRIVTETRNEDADEFISQWTYDPTWHRNNHDDPKTVAGFEAALKAYPRKATTRIYRGLSFSSKADRDIVRQALKSGKLTDKSLSSWTPDIHQASAFAALDGDYPDLVPGFVVSMKPPKGTRMVNAYKAPDSDNEVIVDAGTYDIKVEMGSLDESIILEKKPDTDKNLYRNKDALTLMNIYFATVFMAIVIYKADDTIGIRLLKDRTHYKMTAWSPTMSQLNFWGYPIWHASSPVVKKLIGPKAAGLIFKAARHATPAQPRYLHMDLSAGKDVPIEWEDHKKTLRVLQRFEGMNTDRINILMDGVFKYDELDHDGQVKVLSKLFFYVQQFIPTSPLFFRIKAIQDELILNANGENDQMVQEKLIQYVNALVEDEDASSDPQQQQGQVDTINRTHDPKTTQKAEINRSRRTVKRKRNPEIKRLKFPRPEPEKDKETQ